MATLVGSATAVNMADVTRLQAMLASFATGTSTSTQFTTANPSDGGLWVFTGTSFGGFSGGLPSTGNLTGITLSKSGVEIAVITGLSMTIPDFFAALATNDPLVVGAFMFRDDDTITGSTVGDSLFGFGGNDALDGLAGNDLLNGGSGNNIVTGGDGDDTIESRIGIDAINGGAGSDLLVLDRSTLSMDLSLDLTGAQTDAGVNLADGTTIRNMDRFSIVTGSGADTLTLSQVPILSLLPNSVISFNAGAGQDRLAVDFSSATTQVILSSTLLTVNFSTVMTFSNVELFTVTSGSGNDQLIGGAGADILSGGDGNDMLTGFTGDDVLAGGQGLDSLDGGAGVDTLNGNDGDDTLTTSGGGDVIDGGAGSDLMIVTQSGSSGIAVTFTATGSSYGATFSDGTAVSNIERFNIQPGGSGSDTLTLNGLVTAAGQSDFWASSGDDLFIANLSGASSALNLRSVAGFYELTATSFLVVLHDVERFTISGGSGNDSLETGSGADNLSGGGGADILRGNGGNDTLTGGDGNDEAYGSAGADSLAGEAGNDRLDGGDGADVISGGDGDDQIYSFGDGSVEDLDGGTGTDLLFLSLTSGDVVNDQVTLSSNIQLGGSSFRNFETFNINLGFGDDTLTVTAGILSGQNTFDGSIGSADRLVADLSAVSAPITLDFFHLNYGAVLTNINGFEQFTVTAGSGNDHLDGGAGNDTLIGGAGDDVLAGAAVFAGPGASGNDVLRGGDGNDSISTGNLFGPGSGSSQLFGDGGNDGLTSGDGADQLDGGAGDDSLSSGGGADLLDGGLGNDTINGGGGFDTAVYVSAGSGVTVSLALASAQNTGGAGTDTLTSIENLTGSAFDDTLTGAAGANALTGNAGNDTLTGGSGDDVLAGGAGADTIDGGGEFDTATYAADTGAVFVQLAWEWARDGGGTEDRLFSIETIIGSAFSDVLIGAGGTNAAFGGAGNDWIEDVGDGADVLHGEAGNDIVWGGSGDDSLFGEADNDALLGGTGNDTLDGGTGVDWIYAGLGADTITGGTGDDVLFGAEGGGPDASSDLADTITGGDGIDALIGEGGDDILDGGADNDWAYGGIGNDTITGGTGADRLAGEDGNDTISGGDGNDFVYGAFGDDIVSGGDGNDWVEGSFGNDVITGGMGADSLFGGGGDRFVYTATAESTEAAADVIGVFWRPGGDKIDVSAIDANSFSPDGDTAFTHVVAFSGFAGQMIISFDGTNSVARFDTNGDMLADMAIVVLGMELVAGDFIL